MISGFPIWLCSPKYDWKSYSPRPQDRSEWSVGAAFIAANTQEDVRLFYFLGRCVCIPFILLGAWFGSRLASELYGKTAGLIFATFWTFSPLFLGWGATLCPDMIAASLGMIAVYFFRRWLIVPNWKNVIVAGICIGLLPFAKITWVIAFGLFPLLWILSKNRPPIKQCLVVMLLALYTLNMGYGFDGSFRLLKNYQFIRDSLRDEGTNRFTNSVLGFIPVPFPSEFIHGIDTQKRDFEKGLESYLFGKYQDHGWWYYYFVVLGLKEPLGTLILVFITIILTIFKRNYRSSWNDEILVLVPFFVLLFVICSQTGISIHPRYLLPALPFFYLFVSRIGKAFEVKERLLQIITIICLGWMIVSSMYVYPHSMSYFNEMIPVKKRPEYLLGSNIDWGQSAYFLKNWLEKHPEATPIRIEYPCPENIERIDIKTNKKPPAESEPGWFALGVNDIYANSELYGYFKKCEPVTVIGYSIYVYHLTENDVKRIQKEQEP
ncbi:MAG: glycosyltransferase family 39 protein [Planctomycetaceae bacterium]|nr:glycosyltransferase family 39 protein [Planctomycetaceae bacterium]